MSDNARRLDAGTFGRRRFLQTLGAASAAVTFERSASRLFSAVTTSAGMCWSSCPARSLRTCRRWIPRDCAASAG